MSRTALTQGQIVDDFFEIVSLLGRGGMCSVYKARDLKLERFVALKLLHPQLIAGRTSAVERFRREAVTASSLDHPHIVRTFRFGVFENRPYIAMEYLEGRSLATLIAEQGRLPRETALPIFTQICDAMEHAHGKGVIHRDIKPSNVMLIDNDSFVKVVDFGIAEMLPDTGEELQKLTSTGELLGSIPYMSPEQCSAETIDARSDIYSLGCVMYECLSGSTPFPASTPIAILARHMSDSPEANGYLKDALGRVVFNAMSKSKADRPQSMAQLESALNDPESFAKKLPPPLRVHTLNTRALVIASIVIIGLAAAMLFGFAAPLFLSSQTAPPKLPQKDKDLQVRHWNDRGKTLITEGDFARALDAYNELLKYDPDGFIGYRGKALAYLGLRKRSEALNTLKAGLPNAPSNKSALVDIASIFLKAGDAQTSLVYCHQALERDDSNVAAWLKLNEVHIALSDFKSAENDAQRALKISPKNMFAQVHMATTHSEMGMHDLALSEFTDAVKTHADESFAFGSRAAEYERLGKKSLAAQDRAIAAFLNQRTAHEAKSIINNEGRNPDDLIQNGTQSQAKSN